MGNMGNVKLLYSSTEWAAREQYYIDEINTIQIPADPTTVDVKRVTSEVDSILAKHYLTSHTSNVIIRSMTHS
jgi:hypothetical protein